MLLGPRPGLLGPLANKNNVIGYVLKVSCFLFLGRSSFLVGFYSSDNSYIVMFYLYEMTMVVDGSVGGRVNFNAHTWKKLEILLSLFSNAQVFVLLLLVCFNVVVQ